MDKKLLGLKTQENILSCMLIGWMLLPLIMVLLSVSKTAVNPVSYNYEILVKSYHIVFLFFGILTFMSIYLYLFFILQKGKTFPFLNIVFALESSFFIWSALCTILSKNPIIAFRGFIGLYNGFESMLVYFCVFICAFFYKKSYKIIIQSFCFMMFIMSTLIIAQKYAGGFLDRCFNYDYSIVFNHHNHLGYLLCMSITAFVCLYLFDEEITVKKQVIYAAGIIITTFALLINDTFGSYLASLISFPLIYFFVFRKYHRFKRTDWIPLLIFCSLTLLNIAGCLPGTISVGNKFMELFSKVADVGYHKEVISNVDKNNTKPWNEILSDRKQLWLDTLQRIKEHPVFGLGPDGIYGENAILNNDSPHNEFLQTAAFMGIPGLLLYLSGIIAMFYRYIRDTVKMDTMAISAFLITMTYLISSVFGNSVFNVAPYFWLFLGFASSEIYSKKKIQ